MSVVDELAADLHAIRQALGVSGEMSIEAIVCAVLLMRQESSRAERLRMDRLREVTALQAQLDAERGKAALIMEAFWLAIADLPHADDCTGDVAYPDRPCTCWRSVAGKALDVDEAVKLCTALRDREDELEAANARAAAAESERDEAVHLASLCYRLARKGSKPSVRGELTARVGVWIRARRSLLESYRERKHEEHAEKHAQWKNLAAKAERADGQFRAADLELNALKAKYSQALIELEDLRAKPCFWCGIKPPSPGERTH